MDLAIIDTFARTDSAPKTAPRSSDDASESFAEILDTRMRQPEPVRERPDRPERPESPEAREIPEAKPEFAPEPKSNEPPAAKPRTKSKTEHDAAETVASADQKNLTEGADTGAPASAAKTPTDTLAAAVVADLQIAESAELGDGTPMGLLMAATIVPAVTPEQAAAAQLLSLLSGATAPSQPQEATAAPATTTPAQTPQGAPTPGSTPAPTTATPSPTLGFAPELKAAAPEALPTLPTGTLPVAPTPAPTAMPAEVIAAAPAAAAILAASTEIAPQPDDAAPIDLSLEVSSDSEGDDVLAAVTLGTTGQPATTRPAAGLTTISGYAAQLAVAQDASTGTPTVSTTPELSKEALLAGAVADKAAQAAEISAAADEAIVAKPQEPLFSTASNDPTSIRATAQAEAAAQRGARPAALPVVEQVAVRIHKAMTDGIDRITVKLNPADLGHIDIRMEIGPDGKFNAVFAADRPQTVELLQRDARELARTLQDAGLRTDAGSLSFNLRGQNQGQQNSGHLTALQEALSATNGTDASGDAAPLPANLYSSSNAANGRVDIRV